ncbi:MAG: hypothetical protein GYB39_06695 [Algicola sp.]|nr:hypothetical protein [Algicola sp.]
MKRNLNKILAFASISLLLASCSDDDQTGDSLINNSPVNATLMVDNNNIMVSENGSNLEYTITAQLDAPSNAQVVIDLAQTGGTANGDDIHIESPIIIPAGSTSGTALVEIIPTGNVEEDETFTITATDRGNLNLADFAFNGTITDDYVNNIISFEVDWSGEVAYTLPNNTQLIMDLCDIDFDFLIFDSAFNIVPLYDAATGACPEAIGINSAVLADGTYYLAVDMYENVLSQYGANDTITINVAYSQHYENTSDDAFGAGGFIDESFTLADGSGTVPVATLEVVDGHMYTVTPL